MTIYHGGTDVVEVPRIIKTYSGRDFGVGFYTTDIEQQAVKWAKRQALYRKKEDAVLNVYEFDDSALEILKAKTFKDYTMEWLDFVVACRQDPDFRHDYDIVMGKIANDDVGETVQAVADGLTPKDFALSKLTFMPANNQICFSTDNALKHLKFISSKRVN
jgi:hypothetical protein